MVSELLAPYVDEHFFQNEKGFWRLRPESPLNSEKATVGQHLEELLVNLRDTIVPEGPFWKRTWTRLSTPHGRYQILTAIRAHLRAQTFGRPCVCHRGCQQPREYQKPVDITRTQAPNFDMSFFD